MKLSYSWRDILGSGGYGEWTPGDQVSLGEPELFDSIFEILP